MIGELRKSEKHVGGKLERFQSPFHEKKIPTFAYH
jgi:hypothetical protein